MVYIDQQLRNIILGHLLDFQISYAKVKLIPTNDDLLNLKYKLLVLLEDCYLTISLYEKSEKNKREESKEDNEVDNQENPKDNKEKELNRIKEIEDEIVKLDLIGDSLRYIEDLYDQILEIFNRYLFPKET